MGFILFIAGACSGIFFNSLSIYFLYKFVASSNYEFLMGVAFPLLYSTPSWLFAIIGAYILKNRVNVILNKIIYFLFSISAIASVYFLIGG